MSCFVEGHVALVACPVWRRDNTTVLMIVAQHTSALLHASSMTNTMGYPHPHATYRRYLHCIVAFS